MVVDDRYKEAEIVWDATKKVRPTASLRYSTISKFSEDLDWPNSAWSIMVEFEDIQSLASNPSMGKVRFLSEVAPHSRLRSGVKFELYEGPNRVATVRIK